MSNTKQRGKKMVSLVLAVAMVLTMMPLTVAGEVDGCTHDCGDSSCSYIEEVPCDHLHDENCGEDDESAGGATPSNSWKECTHDCEDGPCTYMEAVACDHRHDENCGGVLPNKDGLLTDANDVTRIAASARTTRAEAIDITDEFTDSNFLAAVRLELGKGASEPIYDTEVSGVYDILLDDLNIASLAGIEYFTALDYLGCSGNQLTELDVSQNTALTTLQCSNNQLTELDVSQNTALMDLECSNNQLTELDVSRNTALTELLCFYNQLTELDVSQNTVLTELSCGGNQLTKLDVSQNTALTTLSCYTNQLTELDVSQNTALKTFFCSNNQLTELDLSGLGSLTSFSGTGQTPSLMVTGSNEYYTANVMMNEDTIFGNNALSYAGGILTSTNNTAATATFVGSTGLAGKTITGTLKLTYQEGDVVRITGISPTSGPEAGGTIVTITGVNIVAATSVTVGGEEASAISVISASQITFTTPPGAVGAKDVMVTTPEGTATLIGGFTYTSDYSATGTMDIGGETGIDISSDHSGTGWTWTASTATLALDNNYSGAFINIACAMADTINLEYTGNISIASTDASALFCEGSLNITGSGTISLNSQSSDSSYSAIDVYNALDIGGSAVVNATCGATKTGNTDGAVIYGSEGVTISGSASVTATATGADANGIFVDWGDITISTNGAVTTNGTGNGYALCIANSENKLNISSGTITLAGTPMNSFTADAPLISGGTLSDGTSQLYLASLTLSGISAVTMVTDITAPAGYSSEWMQTTDGGKLYFLLPAGGHTITLTAGGITYTGTVNVTADHTAAATLTIGGVINICQIGATDYTSLTDALADVGYGQTATIKLLTDINHMDNVSIDNGRKITFNLNGKTLDVSVASGIALVVTDAAAVDITGAGAFNVTSENGEGIYVEGAGSTANVTNATGKGSWLAVGAEAIDGGLITINNNAVAMGSYSIGAWATFGAAIIIRGNAEASGSNSTGAQVQNGTIKVKGNVTATGSNSVGAGAMSGGEITVDGVISGINYTRFYDNGASADFSKTQDQYLSEITKPGYYTYAHTDTDGNSGTSSIWVKIPSTPATYTVAVNNGTGSGSYQQGATVTLTANTPPSGQRFKEWSISPSVTFRDGTSKYSQTAKFTMPEQGVTATATYENVPSGTIPVSGVTLNRTTLSLYSNTSPDTATLTATIAPADATDKGLKWASGNTAVAIVDQSGNVKGVGNGTAWITVTTGDGGYTVSCLVTVSAYSSSGGGGGDTTSTRPGAGITTEKPYNMPTMAKQYIIGTIQDNTLSFIITETMVKNAIDAITNKTDGIAVGFDLNATGYGNIAGTFDRAALEALKVAGVKYVQFSSGVLNLTIDLNTMIEILGQTTGNVTISVVKSENLSDQAKALIGSRPVFDIIIMDGNGVVVSDLNGGQIIISIPYQPVSGEKTGNLYGVYVDGDGRPHLLTNSSYDNGRMVFSRSSLSIYGVGYKEPAPAFADTDEHWAKDDIDFVVSRNLISGITSSTFAPDTTITCAAFLMALGKLSGADVSGYKTSSFTDVNSADPAMPYIEWAVQNKIMTGIGGNQFGPNRLINRQDMAVMMINYGNATGRAFPALRQAVTFADDEAISAYAKDAVNTVLQAGIIAGKSDNLFDPQGSVTRAEVSAILRRFVELILDEGTARGWIQNDSGQWQYINKNGTLAVNTTIDGYKVGADGIWKE